MRYRGAERNTGGVATGYVNTASIAGAWANFDGSAAATLTNSYNVSSLTDNGVGDWTLNWTRPFADANYGVVQQSKAQGAFLSGMIAVNDTGGATTTSLRLQSLDSNEGVVETSAFNSIIVFGNY